jgi:hypothetical protein
VWNDLLLMFGVPHFDSLWTDVMDAIRESDALAEVPARRFAELAGAPLDKLGEIFHKVRIPRNLISIFSAIGSVPSDRLGAMQKT